MTLLYEPSATRRVGLSQPGERSVRSDGDARPDGESSDDDAEHFFDGGQPDRCLVHTVEP
jgi:hypothetical protein